MRCQTFCAQPEPTFCRLRQRGRVSLRRIADDKYAASRLGHAASSGVGPEMSDPSVKIQRNSQSISMVPNASVFVMGEKLFCLVRKPDRWNFCEFLT